MEEYTREQIQRADDTDLYVFLSGRGEQFKRCGKEYRWLRHDSVMINKNEWYRFSQNKGGHAIDFMKEFYGLSFAEAVKELLGEEGVGETNRRTAKEDAGRQKVCPIPLPGLELPERNESCEIVSRPRQHRHLKRKNSILFLVFLDFPHFFIHSGWQDTLF